MARDLLIYVSIPFCTSKCHFCDWVQEIPARDLRLFAGNPRRAAYLASLQDEIASVGRRLCATDYVARIMYWGGGTASILSPDEIESLMECLRSHIDLSNVVEATLECSPETARRDTLQTARSMGFNRVSIGVQSLDSGRLRMIGRSHDATQAIESVQTAKEVGFDNINIDLISGFPGETPEELDKTLPHLGRLPFNHATVYPYRPSSGTVMRRQLRRGSTSIDLEEQIAAYKAYADRLVAQGCHEYAHSHFGQPQCQSDMAYFRLEMDWIGLGSGANSIIGQRYLAHSRGRLNEYIRAPIQYDCDVPASTPSVTRHCLYEALATPGGAEDKLWHARLGTTLAESLKDPSTAGLAAYFQECASLIIDSGGLRIPKDRISRAYIGLLFINAPASSRHMSDARVLFGAH